MDGVNVTLDGKGMTVEVARQIGRSGEPWCRCGFSLTWSLLLALRSFGPPSRALVDYNPERVGCRFMRLLG